MRIGIDCRMARTGEGIARYVEELVKHLAMLDTENEYFLICSKQFPISNFQFPNNFKFQITKSGYYSFAEQTRLIWELKKLKLDLAHFPNFNVPVFYPGRFVITIHDLIHHQFPGKKKSRWFHRLAYRAVIKSAVKRADRIIAVSEATKNDILKTFNIHKSKIGIIYEGVDSKFFQKVQDAEIRQVKQKYSITKPYLLFVGVWRQYKNLPRLARAFDILKERHRHDIELVLAGKIDPFHPEIKEEVFSIRNNKDIKALGYVPDEDLAALYHGAGLFVLPSLTEGFGLIGVEAQAAGVPVAASNIPVLREVLGEGAIYFAPQSPEDIAKKASYILTDHNYSSNLIEKALLNARNYDWSKTARQTLELYSSVPIHRPINGCATNDQ